MGIVPMWGHAKVVESNHPDIAVGERVYGYLPMGTHLDVVPGKIGRWDRLRVGRGRADGRQACHQRGEGHHPRSPATRD